MNNIIKVSVVVTLALVIALFAGCGKKKPAKENESSILMGGDIEDILGKDDEVTLDIGKGELLPDEDEDTVDAGALDKLESSGSSSSEDSSSEDSSSKDSSSNNNSSKNQSSSSKNESSSKNQSSSSKNESSSKTQSSSSKESSSSQTTSSTVSNTDKYTPGWI